MWIKICGMTTPEAVAAALEAQVDAIGFVFAPSVRQITTDKASKLAEPARGRVACFAVMLHPTQRQVDDIVTNFRPDCLQTDAQDFPALNLSAFKGVTKLPVVRSGTRLPSPLPARMLFEGPVSGRGIAFDWCEAKTVVSRAQVILAGGLNESNVAAAIRAVRPFGVDVSSGVEVEPGLKSPEKIMRFAQAARAAFREVEENQR